jgi:hypothetical protein
MWSEIGNPAATAIASGVKVAQVGDTSRSELAPPLPRRKYAALCVRTVPDRTRCVSSRYSGSAVFSSPSMRERTWLPPFPYAIGRPESAPKRPL